MNTNHSSLNRQGGFLQLILQFLQKLVQLIQQLLGSNSNTTPTSPSPSPEIQPTQIAQPSETPTTNPSPCPPSTSNIPQPSQLQQTSTTLQPTAVPISTGMSAPPGYSRLIFDDKFQGTSLDTTKWYPQIGDERIFPWQNNGKLPNPLSGPNEGGYNAAFYDPSQISVNNGLTITAVRDNTYPGYTWKSGVIDTHNKFKFSGGYLQVRAQMPDSRTGGWGAIWSLEGGCEIDTQESGFTDLGQSLVNQEMTSHMPACNSNGQDINSGVDLSAGYHIYGMKYIPGKTITTYLDGKQIAQWLTNIPTGGMTIILDLEIAQNANSWHTVNSMQTPNPLIMKVSEVKVWQ